MENMKIVTTTSVFPRGYSAKTALERIAAAGFDALDMAFDYWIRCENSPFLSDGYLDWVGGLRERAEALGVSYTHSHAPGGAGSDPIIGRTIRAASALGAGYMVLHPEYNDREGKEITDPEAFIKLNAEAVKPWIEMAEKYRVTILSENLLDGASSDPRVIAELVREVGSDRFGWCFDTGHAHCRGFSPRVLTECAAVPLSLHIQDNDGSGDEHLIPGDGTIDWDNFAAVIKEIGYAGDCVLEAHHQCKEAPDSERDAILMRLLDRARILRDKMLR